MGNQGVHFWWGRARRRTCKRGTFGTRTRGSARRMRTCTPRAAVVCPRICAYASSTSPRAARPPPPHGHGHITCTTRPPRRFGISLLVNPCARFRLESIVRPLNLGQTWPKVSLLDVVFGVVSFCLEKPSGSAFQPFLLSLVPISISIFGFGEYFVAVKMNWQPFIFGGLASVTAEFGKDLMRWT